MKIFIDTYGCSANLNNSEIMAGLLGENGFVISSDIHDADIIVINTCIVKGKTENKVKRRIINIIKNNKNKGKKLIVAGCMPEALRRLVEKIAPNASLLGPHHVKEIVHVVENVLKNKKTVLLGEKKEIKLCIPKIRKNQMINIAQICEGCLGDCSYCIVKLAKGKLVSYPEHSIIEEIKKGLKEGCKEIWLTSQDNAAYGKDIKSDLVSLLKKIINDNDIKNKNFFIRIGMMNPNHILPVLDEMITVYKNEKIFKFIHIPVQSGNDDILKRMNRLYKVKDFINVINKFRKKIPLITISTDVIVGFPGETEGQFNDSVDLIKKIRPDVLNISRFWPRPGTKAAFMNEQIHGDITKQRSKRLTEVFNEISLKNNKRWIGWKGKILIDEKGKNNTFIGRNHSYKPVVLKSNKNILGKSVEVRVTEARQHYLIGIMKKFKYS